MDSKTYRNNLSKILISFLLFVVLHSCKTSTSYSKSFLGEEKAATLADQMFDAIGGKKAWCELNSLYIKAEHSEPQMSIPYQSEIWRGIDEFKLVIEQQNDSFHVKGIINELGGTIRYLDKRDTSRILNDTHLKEWEYDHNHNIYVLLHNLGCNPQNYSVRLEKENRLTFYKDTVLYTSFGLDDKFRPYLFYKPNIDGSISGSTFTHWGTDEGLVHSAGGHPLDSNFIYRTKSWIPSSKSLKEMFGEEIFEFKE